MNTISDLDINNVKWVFFFHPPYREDRSGAELFFGTVKNLDPPVAWKPHRMRDLTVQVGKFAAEGSSLVGHFCKDLIDQF
ncbi:MAG: hypothetical protein AB2556_24315, partial [Candidatus Thiodiazotropha sp.]